MGALWERRASSCERSLLPGYRGDGGRGGRDGLRARTAAHRQVSACPGSGSEGGGWRRHCARHCARPRGVDRAGGLTGVAAAAGGQSRSVTCAVNGASFPLGKAL